MWESMKNAKENIEGSRRPRLPPTPLQLAMLNLGLLEVPQSPGYSFGRLWCACVCCLSRLEYINR